MRAAALYVLVTLLALGSFLNGYFTGRSMIMKSLALCEQSLTHCGDVLGRGEKMLSECSGIVGGMMDCEARCTKSEGVRP